MVIKTGSFDAFDERKPTSAEAFEDGHSNKAASSMWLIRVLGGLKRCRAAAEVMQRLV